MTQNEILALHRLISALSKVQDCLNDINLDYISTMTSREVEQLSDVRLFLARLTNDVTNRFIENLSRNLNSH